MVYTPTFTVILNANLSTPTIVVTDTTNWAGQGLSVANMLSVVTIQSPSGVFYNNGNNGQVFTSPDFNGAISQLSLTVNVPLDSQGNVPLGDYVVTVYYQYTPTAQTPVYESGTNTLAYTFQIPTPLITIGWSCMTGQLTATDATAYNNVQGATLLSAVRTMTLTYPSGANNDSPPSPITTSNQILIIGANTANQLWSGVYQVTFSTVCTYSTPNGNVVVTINGYKGSGDVSCNANLCCIQACIYQLFQTWANYIGVNAAQEQFYGNVYFRVLGYWQDILGNMSCSTAQSEQQIVNDIAAIKTLLGSVNCACCPPASDASVLITPLSLVPLNTVVAAGLYISVTPVTVGNTTTYTVAVNNTFIGYVTTLQAEVLEYAVNFSVLNSVLSQNVFTFTGIANHGGNVQLTGCNDTSLFSIGQSINIAQNPGFVNAGYNGAQTVFSVDSSSAITLDYAYGSPDTTRTGFIWNLLTSKYQKLSEIFASTVTNAFAVTDFANEDIAGNTIANNDEIVISGYVLNGTEGVDGISPSSDTGKVVLTLTLSALIAAYELDFNAGWLYMDWKFTIMKLNDTHIKINMQIEYGFIDEISKINLTTLPITVDSFAANTLNVLFTGQSVGVSSGMTCQSFKIEQYKA